MILRFFIFSFFYNITFFEFIQKEFYEPHFNVTKYKKTIKELKKIEEWNIKNLGAFIRKHPKSFDIFQEIFQLRRFTNTQLIHFLFDISILNSINEEQQLNYIKINLKHDKNFKIFFYEDFNKNENDKRLLIKN